MGKVVSFFPPSVTKNSTSVSVPPSSPVSDEGGRYISLLPGLFFGSPALLEKEIMRAFTRAKFRSTRVVESGLKTTIVVISALT